MSQHTREKIIDDFCRKLERTASPRLEMMGITAATAGSGFIASFILLKQGVITMSVRYAIALIFAYIVFLCLLRLWIHWHGYRARRQNQDTNLDPGLDLPNINPSSGTNASPSSPTYQGGGGKFGGGGASSSFESQSLSVRSPVHTGTKSSDGISGFALDEGVVIVVILGIVVGTLATSLWVVYTAPILLAEMLVDGLLARGLYRRMQRQDTPHWMLTALKHTILPILITFILFVVGGSIIQNYIPQARSMGDVIRELAK